MIASSGVLCDSSSLLKLARVAEERVSWALMNGGAWESFITVVGNQLSGY